MKDYRKPEAEDVTQTEFECPACLSGRLVEYLWLGDSSERWYSCNDATCDLDYHEKCLLAHYPFALS
jgi:hypothetical protein